MSNTSLPPYSVLMSVYLKDKPEFLDAAIESMVGQTEPFFDMVLVCDGPLGEDVETCVSQWQRALGNRLNVVRLEENHGLGFALNVGLEKCRCGIVARMDADDISRPERCRKLLQRMTEEDLALIGGAIEEFDKKPGDMGAVRMPPLTQREINMRLKRRNPFNHMSVMFDRNMVKKAGGYEPFPWMEDYWLWVRMIAQGCKCANVPDIIVDARTGEGMYARRSNMAYLRSQVSFFHELKKLGLVNCFEETKAIVERTIATALPTGVVKTVYNKLLRERSAG